MAIARPQVKIYGSSFGEYGGDRLHHYQASGDINPSSLNRNEGFDVGEFNPTEQRINDYVLAHLGHPVVRVELVPFQIKTAIDEAISLLHYRAPRWTRQFAAFNASADINVYEIPQFMIHNLEYVVYKKSLLSIQAQAGTLEFDFFIKYFQDNYLFQDFNVGEFYLLQQHMEQIRKILSQEGAYDVVNGKYIQLTPTPVITPQPVVIVYRALDSETMHPYYLNWLQRYTLAICKGILGRTLGKHKSLPGPGGGTVLDGPELREESVREKELLLQELIEAIEEPPMFSTF